MTTNGNPVDFGLTVWRIAGSGTVRADEVVYVATEDDSEPPDTSGLYLSDLSRLTRIDEIRRVGKTPFPLPSDATDDFLHDLTSREEE